MFAFDLNYSNVTALLSHISSYFIDTINIMNLVIAPSTSMIVDAANELGLQNVNIYVVADIFYQNLTTKNITGINVYQSDSYYYGEDNSKDISLFSYVKDYLNFQPGYYDGYVISGLNSLSFIVMTLNQTFSTNIDIWKKILIDMEIDCPQGKLRMQKNHQLTNYFYIKTFEYNSTVGYNVVKLLYSTKTPLYMFPYTPYQYYIADFSDSNKGAKYYDSPSEIAIIFPISGKKAKYNYDSLYVIIGAIYDFNGIEVENKKRIMYHIYDTEVNSETWNKTVEEIRNNKNITFIIGGEYVRSKNHFTPRNDQIYFAIGNTPAEECVKNIITFGTTPNQIFNGLNNWLGNNGYKSMYIYYNPEYPYTIYKDILVHAMSEMFKINVTQMISKIAKLRNYLFQIPENIPIILLCDSSDTYTFLSLLRLLDFDYETRNPIITLVIDSYYEMQIDLKGLYFLTPYCDKALLFEEYQLASYRYSTLEHGSAYGFFSYLGIKSLFLSINEYNRNEMKTIDDMLNYLYTIEIMGYSIQKSNYIPNYFFVRQYEEDNTVLTVSSIGSLIYPEPYNFFYNDKKTYICDFTTVGDHHFLAAKYVLLIHGSRSYYDFGLQETATMAVAEINDNCI